MIKSYSLPETIPFTEEKKKAVLELFEGERIEVTSERNRLEIKVLGDNLSLPSFLRIRFSFDWSYIITPQYEIQIEGENPHEILSKVEEIIGLAYS